MKNVLSIFVGLVFSISASADDSDSLSIKSAMNWLNLVDAGDYEKSWNQAAPFFQDQLSVTAWVDALNQVRAPLGKVTSRVVNSANSHSSLPNVPDGEYMVIALVTDFENKPASIETITVIKTNDQWQTVGYFIK